MHLDFKQRLTMSIRVGNGYDVHLLADGLPFFLGGIKIEHIKGCVAHSDGDTLIHALCDAMLGALALGDIGKHFPDTDPTYKGVDSLKLAQHVSWLLTKQGYCIGNIDATVIAQAPKLAPHIPAMKQNLACALGCDPNRINIKATTEERLGFTGEGLGIAAHAVCLIERI